VLVNAPGCKIRGETVTLLHTLLTAVFPPSRIFLNQLPIHRRNVMKKYVYSFGGGSADGDRKRKTSRRQRAPGLAEMSAFAGPGFTIPQVCNLILNAATQVPPEVDAQMNEALASLEAKMGQQAGRHAESALGQRARARKFSMPA